MAFWKATPHQGVGADFLRRREMGPGHRSRLVAVLLLGILLGISLLGGIVRTGVIPAGSRPNTPSAPAVPGTDHSTVDPRPDLGPPVSTPVVARTQPFWSRATPPNHPGGRFASGMVYDPNVGGLVLFGGITAAGQSGIENCTNQTWEYVAGNWTMIPASAPAPAESCIPLMAWDPNTGSIVAVVWSPQWNSGWMTWEFSNQNWSRVNISTPHVGGGVLAYDPNLGSLVLFGPDYEMTSFNDSMWEFGGSSWQQVSLVPRGFGPAAPGEVPIMTYDPESGDLLLLQGNTGNLVGTTDTWEYDGSRWVQTGSLPTPYMDGSGSMAFYPGSQAVVEYGGAPGLANTTWLFSGGSWTNSSAASPESRQEPAMTYDPAIGAVVVFGGMYQYSATRVEPMNDTWLYGYPQEALDLEIATQPAAVCSVVSPTCGLGINETTVTLTVRGVPSGSPLASGPDEGSGRVAYGQFRWAEAPNVTFVSFGSLTVALPLYATAVCGATGYSPTACPASAVVGAAGDGKVSLRWQWPGGGPSPNFVAGDFWSLSFGLVALGPPFGQVPVDRCATVFCLAHEGGRGAEFSNVETGLFGNGSSATLSFPYGSVWVLGPDAGGGSPSPLPSPPPPPPSPSGPVPVGTPVANAPSSVGSGVTPSGSTLLLGAISPTGAVAGVIAAGATRAAIASRVRAQRIPIAVRSRGR